MLCVNVRSNQVFMLILYSMRQYRLRYGQTSNQNQQTANIQHLALVAEVKGLYVAFEYYTVRSRSVQVSEP